MTSVSEFTAIVVFIGDVIVGLFSGLNSVYIYEDVSILVVFISIILFTLILDFIIRLVSEGSRGSGDDEDD